MGYLAFAFLIGVIIWTFWRMFTRKRLPQDYFTSLEEAEKRKSVPQTNMKDDETISDNMDDTNGK